MENINNYTFSTHPIDTSAPLRQIVPAKARDGRSFLPKHRYEIYRTSAWVAQEKLDGERLVGHIEPDYIRFTSRRQSTQTKLMCEKTNNVPHLREVARLIPEFAGSVIDGEVIAHKAVDTIAGGGTLTSTASIMNSSFERSIETQRRCGWIDYCVFDCLFYKGQDIRNRPYYERYAKARFIVETINERVGFELYTIVPFLQSTDEAEQVKFYEDIVAAGGEGLVWKNLQAKYGETNSMIKQKKETTFDVFITGWEYGKVGGKWEHAVGALVCSVYDGDTRVEVCKVVPGDDATRMDMTNHFEKYQDRVIEIAGQEATDKNHRIRHPRIFRYRPDKTPQMCTMDQFLKEDN